MSYKDTASFGKRQEYIVTAELLKRGFDVYMTLVDDQGIDCIIRLDEKHYLDIQIKARSETAKQSHLFAGMKIEKVRPNYYFIFYTENDGNLWIIPSEDLKLLCSVNKTGKHVGKMSLNIPKSNKVQEFDKYKNENGFKLLAPTSQE